MEDLELMVVLSICEYVHSPSTAIPKGMGWLKATENGTGHYIPIHIELSFYKRT